MAGRPESARYEKGYFAHGRRSSPVATYLFLKRCLLRLCKLCGLFELASRSTRGSLRVLCYHGFALDDECAFSRRTFISPETFAKRMAHLRDAGFRVLPLDGALDALEAGTLPPKAVVLTIDDGFYGVIARAVPILRANRFPATVYLTTYYAGKESPVFNLVVQYLFWKTRRTRVDLSGLGLDRAGETPIEAEREKRALIEEIVRYGDGALDEPGRVNLGRALGRRLAVDYDEIARKRLFNILTIDEIGEVVRAGFDVELHTHRHEFPFDRERALREIADNRAVLEPIAGRRLVHFCYPSGIWSREQWPWLEEAGIRSAATCDRGLDRRDTPRYGLLRVGDDEGLSQIEFEAEVWGFLELLRSARRLLRS